MRLFLNLGMLTFLFVACQSKPSDNTLATNTFEIGIIADCQYCYCEANGQRFYKNSPKRLSEAVDILNKKELNYTIHLGDFIDRDFKSFDTLMPIWNRLHSKKYHVLGNHDFQVADSLKSSVFQKMDLKEEHRYYSFSRKNWRFIVLDGNDLSFHGSLDDVKKEQTDSLYNKLLKDSLPYLQKWNGGLSKKQLNWVKNELDMATEKNENVGFYCHFPIFPMEAHNLWNRNELIDLIEGYDCVKLYFNGHNHAGAYEMRLGVHYLTFQGMVETNNTSAFAIAKFTADSVIIKGYGREMSRKFKVK